MFQWKKPVIAACAATLLASVSTAAYAEKDMRDVVRSSSGKPVVSSFGDCVRTQWPSEGDPCAPDASKQVATSPARQLQKEARTVYFEFDKYSLTPEAQQKLDSLANVLKSDKEVHSASIVGYADPMGTKAYNEKLSKRRAQAVKNYLATRGYLKTNMADVRWFGEENPKADCPASMKRAERIACLQPDRRVEVEIQFVGDVPAAAAPAPAPAKPVKHKGAKKHPK